ncbi:MAG: hypothetical protein IJJ26_12505 [Victivallales bacterium]|nr:hypothetical protein [Victivallales bacterium]
MLPYLAQFLKNVWGPFRLLESYLMLAGLGAFLAALFSWLLLPRLWDHLPHDQGKAFVKDSEKAKGKPTGAGAIIVPICCLVTLLILPLSRQFAVLLCCLFLSMLTGYLDDRSERPWGRLKKGLLDALITILAAAALCWGKPAPIWLPVFKGPGPGGSFLMPVWAYIPVAAFLLWFAINAVNCSDGVDGLAGSLALLTLVILGFFLYIVMGHSVIAKYLLLPHYPDGARWALLLFTASGMLCGYLWHNASPSAVLMGDAGSRFLGLLIGMAALATGNPLFLLITAPILIINGGTGLVKILFFQFLRKLGFDIRQPLRNVPNPINPKNFATDEEVQKQLPIVRAFHRVRFPLHDQCRKNWHWSDTQVLVRFVLLQALLVPFLMLLFIKVR